MDADEFAEFEAWSARNRAAAPRGGLLRTLIGLGKVMVAIWLLIAVLCVIAREVEAMVVFVFLAAAQYGMVVLFRRYLPPPA